MLHSSVEKVLDNLIKHLNKSVTSALDVNYLTQLTQNTKKGKCYLMFYGESKGSKWKSKTV